MGEPSSAAEIVVTSAWDDSEVGRVKVATPDEVKAAVERGRQAQAAWGARSVRDRARLVRRARGVFLARAEELIDILMREGGKNRVEAMMLDVAPPALYMTYFARAARRALKPRRIPGWGISLHKKTVMHYVPRGVVGVISPWNYPITIGSADIVAALLAGNSVVVKPSEWTPIAMDKFRSCCLEAGIPADVFQVVHGRGEVGAALIDARPDKLVFTGSVAVGRKVGVACAERFVPYVLELGGKAPAVVLNDADVDRTARALIWGGFANCGQTCVSVERVYALPGIHDALVKRVVELTESLRWREPFGAEQEVGAMPFPGQVDVVDDLVSAARTDGASILTGGTRPPGPGRYYPPTVIAGTNQDMRVMHEEVFGPVVPFMKVDTADEAVRLANESHLALNAYVFGGDKTRTLDVARRIQAGFIMVNDTVVNYGYPETPFHGFKHSGMGSVHGIQGLRSMCQERIVSRGFLPFLRREFWWHPYSHRFWNFFLKVARTAIRPF